jgi:hypothetical protein
MTPAQIEHNVPFRMCEAGDCHPEPEGLRVLVLTEVQKNIGAGCILYCIEHAAQRAEEELRDLEIMTVEEFKSWIIFQ